MSKYKGYDPKAGKKATLKYIKTKQVQKIIRWKKEDYESYIEPAIKESGMAVSTFIKEAVDEKIRRQMKLSDQ